MQPGHVSRGRFRCNDLQSNDAHSPSQLRVDSDEMVDDIAHLENVATAGDEEYVALAYLHGLLSHR